MQHPRYATVEKHIGETPLQATERLRARLHIPPHISLAYAGRLDPMATGKLLILIGDECKVQTQYHSLDKQYEVEMLLGVRSDSGDVLGITTLGEEVEITHKAIQDAIAACVGTITLPYPHFSAKTVAGKPLHTWTMENRLSEIDIPQKTSTIYSMCVESVYTTSKPELLALVERKVDSIPPVTDERKKLGADFRRDDVRTAWKKVAAKGPEQFTVISFTCIASSGTYMRSLAEHVATRLGTTALALSIHRTTIGKYRPVFSNFGFWAKRF